MKSGMTAVVTGGAGFIGSHLTDELIRRGYNVRVVDNLVAGKKEHIHKEAEFHMVDVCDTEALRP
ncbi:MAG: NAD-dependent epimerase/dehydratase family protein, partial [Patescibacteria group bacterium]